MVLVLRVVGGGSVSSLTHRRNQRIRERIRSDLVSIQPGTKFNVNALAEQYSTKRLFVDTKMISSFLKEMPGVQNVASGIWVKVAEA